MIYLILSYRKVITEEMANLVKEELHSGKLFDVAVKPEPKEEQDVTYSWNISEVKPDLKSCHDVKKEPKFIEKPGKCLRLRD